MFSVLELRSCAAKHLAAYTDRTSHYAFTAYDMLGDPDQLSPTDCLAPGLLQAPLDGHLVIQMWREVQDDNDPNPYQGLRQAMQAVLDDEEAKTATFWTVDLDDRSGPWGLVLRALIASDRTRGIKASKVTKTLHRKRPWLVPIFDSKVAAAYGSSARRPSEFWPRLQEDLFQQLDWLSGMATVSRTPDGRELSPLRVIDIIVWHHAVSGCSGRE